MKHTVFHLKGLIPVFGTFAKMKTFQRFIVSDDDYCYYYYDQFKEMGKLSVSRKTKWYRLASGVGAAESNMCTEKEPVERIKDRLLFVTTMLYYYFIFLYVLRIRIPSRKRTELNKQTKRKRERKKNYSIRIYMHIHVSYFIT